MLQPFENLGALVPRSSCDVARALVLDSPLPAGGISTHFDWFGVSLADAVLHVLRLRLKCFPDHSLVRRHLLQLLFMPLVLPELVQSIWFEELVSPEVLGENTVRLGACRLD